LNPRELAMADEARSRLGRGLASLIGDVGGEAAHLERPRAQRKVPIEFLKPNPRNPRRAFSDAELGELADSIRQHGVIQPIVVRPVRGAQDRFEIIAGERRWRASQIAGLHEVPIVPVDVSDSDALEIAIIENVQREDLNAMEEAQGYHALADEFKRSQDEIAKIVGKSRSHVANMMRLTKLPAEVQAYIASGQLSAGHARALIGVPDPLRPPNALSRKASMCVRPRRWRMSRVCRSASRRSRAAARRRTPIRSRWKKRVSDALGLAVSVDHRDPGGTVHIRYRDLDQLDEIVRRLDSKSCARKLDLKHRGSSQTSIPGSLALRAPRRRPLSAPPLRVHRDRQQRALRDHGGQRGLLAHLQRRGGELLDDRQQPRRAEVAQRGLDI
jgi:ParB family chromosome partitioning protein